MTEENIVSKLAAGYAEAPIIRSLLQLVPGWGMSDTLLVHRAGEIREKRMRTFFDELAKGTCEITEELAATDQFLHCYFATLTAALRTNRQDKIRMFARLLRTLPQEGEPDDIVDMYEEELRLLDSLSPTAILLLFLSVGNKRGASADHDWNKGPFVNHDYPEIPEHVIWNSYEILRTHALIPRGTNIMAAIGPAKVPWIALRLSEYGKSFVSHVFQAEQPQFGG